MPARRWPRSCAVCFVDLGLRRVTANCFADNEASWRLMERLGMRRETPHAPGVAAPLQAGGSTGWATPCWPRSGAAEGTDTRHPGRVRLGRTVGGVEIAVQVLAGTLMVLGTVLGLVWFQRSLDRPGGRTGLGGIGDAFGNLIDVFEPGAGAGRTRSSSST